MADEKKKKCDCEHHEHDHHDHDCDCGCDCEMEDEVIMLEDEDGNEIPFYHIATLEHEGKDYAYLQQADDEDEPMIEIFELEEVEDDEEGYYNLIPIEEDLYEVLFKRLTDEIEADSDDEE